MMTTCTSTSTEEPRHAELVLPVCPFFSGYLQKHPEWSDVVHPTYRGILGI